MKHIVITGNPIDGLFFYGPFDDPDQAGDWASINHDGAEWWTADLMAPEVDLPTAVPVRHGYFDDMPDLNDDETIEDIDRLLSDDA